MRNRTLQFSLIASCLILIAGSYAYGVDNILANGGLEDQVLDPWSVYGDATMEIVIGDAAEGVAYMHLTTPQGGNFWDAGLQHAGHIFEAGKKYTLAAFLRSPDGLQINFKPELAADPWTGFGSQEFTMTDSWEEYYVETGEILEQVDPASITFHIAYAVGEFDIDGVRFFEGDYVPPPGPAAVEPSAKLTTAWGKIKSN